MVDTPEQRRDDAIAGIIAAGGSILGTEPLAEASDPSTIVAYRVTAGVDSLDVLHAVNAVKRETESDLSGLVSWQPPVEDGAEA